MSSSACPSSVADRLEEDEDECNEVDVVLDMRELCELCDAYDAYDAYDACDACDEVRGVKDGGGGETMGDEVTKSTDLTRLQAGGPLPLYAAPAPAPALLIPSRILAGSQSPLLLFCLSSVSFAAPVWWFLLRLASRCWPVLPLTLDVLSILLFLLELLGACALS